MPNLWLLFVGANLFSKYTHHRCTFNSFLLGRVLGLGERIVVVFVKLQSFQSLLAVLTVNLAQSSQWYSRHSFTVLKAPLADKVAYHFYDQSTTKVQRVDKINRESLLWYNQEPWIWWITGFPFPRETSWVQTFRPIFLVSLCICYFQWCVYVPDCAYLHVSASACRNQKHLISCVWHYQ